ncbi:MAG: FAD dependent oxidoreductase [Chloroflexi bacterium OLB15]|nr:MAG: FAD dependent oxidoreductase [Chloroflexi bacterium OLB15]
MSQYDIIIIGAGALGSATAYHAARQGLRVLLLEQFEFDHGRGSSHGASRIIRYAYNREIYVQMAALAFAGWRNFEQESGQKLMHPTGGLDFGPRGEPHFEAMLTALTAQQIPFELMSADEGMKRFPQFRFDDDFAVLYQADASVLEASKCVLTHLNIAETYGAALVQNAAVTYLNATPSSVTVVANGVTYSADRLIVTAGAWANQVLAHLNLQLPLQPVRCQENYYDFGHPKAFEVGNFPVFIAHLLSEYGYMYMPYGLPSVNGSGVKLSLHGGPPYDPETADRTPDTQLIETMLAFAARYFSKPAIRHINSRLCLYTMTPDEDFIIDRHPEFSNVIIGACCSGHAFKFSHLIGDFLTKMATDQTLDFNLDAFKLSRFDTSEYR